MISIKIKFEGKTLGQQVFYINKATLVNKKISKLFLRSPSFINIFIYQNKKSFLDAIKKISVPDWLIAHTNKSNIYLIDAKLDRKKISQLIFHEIVHIYTNLLNNNLPIWVKEGVSVYLSDQLLEKRISEINWKKIAPNNIPFKKIAWQKTVEYGGYNIAGLLIMFLKKRYGWNNLIKLLSLYKKNHDIFYDTATFFGENYKNIIHDFRNTYLNKKG